MPTESTTRYAPRYAQEIGDAIVYEARALAEARRRCTQRVSNEYYYRIIATSLGGVHLGLDGDHHLVLGELGGSTYRQPDYQYYEFRDIGRAEHMIASIADGTTALIGHDGELHGATDVERAEYAWLRSGKGKDR